MFKAIRILRCMKITGIRIFKSFTKSMDEAQEMHLLVQKGQEEFKLLQVKSGFDHRIL